MAAEDVSVIQKAGVDYRTVQEGKATILVPQGAKIGKDAGEVQQVFYNPIQQYNRDLSTLAIKAYGEKEVQRRREQLATRISRQNMKKRKRPQHDDLGRDPASNGTVDAAQQKDDDVHIPNAQDQNLASDKSADAKVIPFKILDALSASGLRALRYARELPFVTSIHANDLSKSATESIKLNVDYNNVADKVVVTNEDAMGHMYRAIADDMASRDRHGNPGKSHKWDVIDLDPYGTAAPFFDAAVQAVRDDGGLLCITCTDSAVWAGHSYCEKAFSLYGGTPVKNIFSHEVGLRLILNAVAMSAARYGLAIEPQLSLSIDFYTKLFIKVQKSPQAVKFLGAKTMMLYSCDSGCSSWETQYIMRSKASPNKSGSGWFYKHVMAQGPTSDRNCAHCGFRMHINGPMYGGPIHNPEFVSDMLAQLPMTDPEVYGTLPRLEGMLHNVLEEHIAGPEVTVDVPPRDAKAAEIETCPFYHHPSKLANVLSCRVPPDDLFRGALKHLGYKVGRSHCKAGSLKTDAPWSSIWWVMTEWIRQKAPIKPANIKKSSAAWKILLDAGLVGDGDGNEPLKSQDAASDLVSVQEAGSVLATAAEQTPELKSEAELRKTLVFDEALARLGRDSKRQGVRYQINPRENWGPLTKASKN